MNRNDRKEMLMLRFNEILFGSAYYLEYMPVERLEKDIAMMKKIGMNVLRIAESTWSSLEPVEGTYDFSYIDRVLSIAERENLWVIIGTPTYAFPSWLEKKHPEVMVYDGHERAKYGRRQIMDITCPAFLEYAEKIIRVLMEHVKDHPRVIGYQIDNETKHYSVASEKVQEEFVEYLKEKFVTTDNLNQTFGLHYWSNAIHDWADFPDISGCCNGGLAGEFAAFQRGLVSRYLNWQAKLVDEYRREDQFITHNFDFEWRKFGADIAQDGYSYGVQPSVNHAEASKAVTIAGTDIYHPTQDYLTGAEIAFGGDSIRSLKQDHYFVLECQAQAFKYWTPYPGQLFLQAMSHLASGAMSVLYWNWHSIHSGYETYWKGLLSHDLEENPTYLEAGRIGGVLEKFGKEKLCIKKQNKVALVIDNRSLNAFKWFPIDKDLSYNDVVRWMYDSLYEMSVECDVVDLQELDTERYDLIITPALYCISEEKIQSLRAFVERGGVLLSSFKSFVASEQVQVYHDSQPHMLTDIFGMSYNQFTSPGTSRLKGQPIQYFMELLKTESAESLGDYEHKYWGKYAGITKNQVESARAEEKGGTAYYVAAMVSKDILKELYRDALETAGIEIPSNEAPVIIRSGVNALGENVHYLLHYSQDEKKIECPFEKVSDILTGNVYQKGEEITLSDWDVKILVDIV